MIIPRYCSIGNTITIDIVHIEVAVNYVVCCRDVTYATIGRVMTHDQVHMTKQNAVASHKLTTDD